MVKTATKRKDNETASIKKRLSAALCMLLVSLIMLISSTYAWFTLSTAPEAANIATTVTGNGSLEIALMPKEGTLSEIKSGRASVNNGGTVPVTEANTSWGNLVDLTDVSYGLSNISLYPSAFNLAAESKDSPLKVPTYGYDGRAEDWTDTILTKWSDTDFAKANGYGVRGIATISGGGEGEGDAVTPLQGLASYGYVVDLAFRTNAVKSSTENAKLLLQAKETQRIYAEGTNESTMGAGSTMTFTKISQLNMPVPNLLKLLGAIRVTFVQNYGNSTDTAKSAVLMQAQLYDIEIDQAKDTATAKIGLCDGTEEREYKYNVTDAEGNTTEESVKINAPVPTDKADQSLVELGKNQAVQVSAIVWLDGANITNAEASASQGLNGTLNLQFTTDAALTPANNSTLNPKTETETTPNP